MNINWTNPFWSVGLFGIYVILSCFGLYLMKAAEGWKTAVFVIGIVFYGTGAAIWMIILRLMPLSFAFPIAAGILIVGTLLIGIFFLNEAVSVRHIAGSVMIIIGIALIAVNR